MNRCRCGRRARPWRVLAAKNGYVTCAHCGREGRVEGRRWILLPSIVLLSAMDFLSDHRWLYALAIISSQALLEVLFYVLFVRVYWAMEVEVTSP
jgi:hypothetical protein